MYRTILRLCQTRSPLMSSNKNDRSRNGLSSPRELWERLSLKPVSLFLPLSWDART
jgi:hypothetical protein